MNATAAQPLVDEALGFEPWGVQGLALAEPARRPVSSGAVASGERRARARRRRLLFVVAVAGLLVALALPWGGTGEHPLAVPGPVPAGAARSQETVYVVHPGDTLWSIATRLDPTGDPRVLVSRLEAEVGGDVVTPGQRLVLP